MCLYEKYSIFGKRCRRLCVRRLIRIVGRRLCKLYREHHSPAHFTIMIRTLQYRVYAYRDIRTEMDAAIENYQTE